MKYQYLIISNLPAFYKINLYNKLNELFPIKVVFISSSSLIRNKDFIKGKINFEYEVLTDTPYEKRNKFLTFLKVLKLLNNTNYKIVLFPGWELLELIPLMLLNKREKNGIVIESSILETNTTGLVWKLKKLIINRMGHAFPSGVLQEEILNKADYKAETYITYGVGLPLRNQARTINERTHSTNNYRYLYVGRVSPEKNIKRLVSEFNKNGRHLSIVGDGVDLEDIKRIAKDNIKFYGYVNNSDLAEIYKSHDFFILPSLSEPWGLVVDEALWYGLPCLVSKNVGCSSDLVESLDTGLIFDPEDDFEKMLITAESNFDKYLQNVGKIDFDERDMLQVNSYKI
ncbi:glycosyltransferase [Photobacterium atrarenae]|uniref:Glycosyltransferase family 4 protein n=1 Tax=Photobacterium atrarenae TaxID=865757 RepID=A0ABY5GCR8_9GAMM|nr:glycosyltransferase [Photobacterium atrarenae]UTV26972.1 glycosyltransferase family 4 protein [Photobacterium atrarenae]